MLISFYGDHTHTSTQSNSVSHVLAPSHTRSKRDQARSNSIGLILDKRATSLTSSPWLCAFAILAYWILSFCFWGLFLFLLVSVLVAGFGELHLGDGFRRRACTEGLWKREKTEESDWKQTHCVTLCLYTQLMDRLYEDDGLLCPHISVFTPAQSNWMPKLATCVVGLTGANWTVASMNTWLVFLVTYFWTCISSVYHCFCCGFVNAKFCLWALKFMNMAFECVLFSAAVLLSPRWVCCQHFSG